MQIVTEVFNPSSNVELKILYCKSEVQSALQNPIRVAGMKEELLQGCCWTWVHFQQVIYWLNLVQKKVAPL